MKTLILLPAIVLSFCLAVPSQVQAASFLLTFEAGPFNPGSAPDNPVTGSFIYEAATSTSPITGLSGVNLTINGNVYTLADIGFDVSGSESTIGALTNGGAGSISGGSSNDFRLVWDHTTQTASDFRYTTASTNPLFTLANGASVSPFTITAIPEPGTMSLAVLLGAGALAGRRLRRREDAEESADEAAAATA